MVAAKATRMTWVLLRGLTREARHWGSFANQLASHLGEKVLTPDMPGSGEFFCQPSPLTVRANVDAVRQHLQASGARPPFALMGMSMGGMAAADWAQRYPDEISQLVLINTSMRPFSSLAQRLRPHSWLLLARIALRWNKSGQAAAIEGVIHQLTCKQAAHNEADIAAWSGIRLSAPVSAGNAVRQLMAAAKFSCAPTAPRHPVLVLSSARDQLVNPLCSAQLAAAWNAPHLQHEAAGHDLPHDDGAWICRQVAMWRCR